MSRFPGPQHGRQFFPAGLIQGFDVRAQDVQGGLGIQAVGAHPRIFAKHIFDLPHSTPHHYFSRL
jgi:hypothetical protein